MRTLKTSEAAGLLNVSASTLRAWEQRFGFPQPRRSPGHHRRYTYGEVSALRDALEAGLSISSAVSVARDTTGWDKHALVSALTAFEADRADRAMESSVALRTLERSLEDVLLGALEVIRQRKGLASAAWAFATRWCSDWLLRARRFGAGPARRGGLLIGDASVSPLDPVRPYVLALELCCVRSGIEVLSLPVQASARLDEAADVVSPDVVVIAGDEAPDDEVARWAYGVRECAGRVPFVLYRRALVGDSVPTRRQVLAPSPVHATTELLAICDSRNL
jgi:DNA-binding transcriptional MerR regulator